MRFAFRVDSSPQIGLGHLMRCLTLANALKDRGFDCYFICRDFKGNGSKHVLENGFELRLLEDGTHTQEDTWLGVSAEDDISACLPHLKSKSIDWLVVDHYAIDRYWHSFIRKAFPDLKIMVIDDLANRPHDCDLLLDQTYGRKREAYQTLIPEYAKFCGGTDYALLRKEFVEVRNQYQSKFEQQNDEPHILVTLGGGDIALPLQVIKQSLERLLKEHTFTLTVIVGESDKAVLNSFTELSCHVELISFSKDMPHEMGKADLAIGAAGGTSWERCCVGLPSIVLTLADNQIEIAKILHDASAGISLKTESNEIFEAAHKVLSDRKLLNAMSINASKLCDGKGVARLINSLVMESLSFNKVELSDAKFIYDARYEDGGSQFYRNSQIPTYESHVSWLEGAIENSARILANVSLFGENIAHLRCDLSSQDKSHGEIGICLSSQWRGKGVGASVLMAANQYFSSFGVKSIEAEIHENNLGSKAIFIRAGYEHVSTDSTQFMRYLWRSE